MWCKVASGESTANERRARGERHDRDPTATRDERLTTRDCESRAAASIDLGPVGGERAGPQQVIVHAEERVNHTDEELVLLGVRDSRQELVHLRACVIAEVAARLFLF